MFSFAKVRVLCVFVFSLSLSGLTQAAISQVISFGDSLSDTGNIFATTGEPIPPYFDGNFTNGPVWVELLAPMVGAPAATASLDGGTNYAWGGARTTLEANGFIPSTQAQVATYLGDVGGVADADALYTILTGGNDLRAFDGVTYDALDLAADGMAVASIADDLLMAGAQNILVVNVPDLGLAPVSEGNEALATFFTSQFNEALADGLAALGSPNVTLLDSFTVTQDIAANPGVYGFTNIDDPCFDADAVGGPTLCADPSQYLFWDDLHPTAAGQQLIADAAFAAVVPVPAALWLFGSALMGLVVIKRKR